MRNDDARTGLTAQSPPTPWFLRSRRRLLSISSVLLLALLAIPAVLIATQVRQSMRTQSIHENGRTAQIAARMVDAHLDGLRRYVESYARRKLFRDAVARPDDPLVREYLDELVRANPHFDRAFVTDARGTLWADFPPA